MTDEDAYHRTFLPGSGANLLGEGEHEAWVIDEDANLTPTLIKPRQDQIFRQHCTNFEIVFSTLNESSNKRVYPVIRKDGALIGHRGVFNGQEIWIPFQPRDTAEKPTRPWMGTIEGLTDCLVLRREVFANITPGYGTGGHVQWGSYDQKVTVLLDLDGNVLLPLKYETVGVVTSWLQAWDIIEITLIVQELVKFVAGAVAKPIANRVTSTVSGWFGKKAGSVTIREMEGFLADVLAKNPELAQLMRARVLSGDSLKTEAMAALGKWSQRTGKGFEFVENGAVQKVAGVGNYASFQGGKLLIEKDVAANATRLYSEVVHELSANSLGVSGKTLSASQLPFIGESINLKNNAFFILENGIKEDGGIFEIMEDFF